MGKGINVGVTISGRMLQRRAAMIREQCRFCHNELKYTFLDLGMSPLANSYILTNDTDKGQMTYPLHVKVCEKCWLVQLGEFESPQAIFSDYAYFSSYSSSWLAHAKKYADHMIEDYGINTSSQVVEIASNDGYLLQYFKEKEIPVLGIEPAKNVAEVAREKGISTISDFFGVALAKSLRKDGRKADLLIGNNVFAHVPDINDFVEGLRILLAEDGILTLEFPHLLNLIEKNQFDTIYHEHFSYISLLAAKKILASHGLRIFDVEELPTHGGSLRLYISHDTAISNPLSQHVEQILTRELESGLECIETYSGFSMKVRRIKYDLLSCLINMKRLGKKVVGYGAAAKGNTLLNYCGIGSEFLDYVVDKNPYKQNTLLPGSRIPVYAPDRLLEERPDSILILPWNIEEEIVREIKAYCSWPIQFVVPIPEVHITE